MTIPTKSQREGIIPNAATEESDNQEIENEEI